jgi:ferredoxin-NADP reductase
MKEEVMEVKPEPLGVSANEHIVKIISINQVTHNVKQFRLNKPQGYEFVPGQATEVSINSPAWKNERRPFTFTSLNDDPYLELTIKIYNDHQGVTNALNSLQAGDELIVHEVWGAISYKGPGYFIAGGAGITPFISILRQLKKENRVEGNTLFFSNRTANDIILKEELENILGAGAIFLTTHEESGIYESKRIDEEYLQAHVSDPSKYFYVCGPDKMITDINAALEMIGAKAEAVIFEK